MKILLLIPFLLVSCSRNSNAPSLSKPMLEKAELVCEKNGSIEKMGVFKDDETKIYLYCKTQGLVIVNQKGLLENVLPMDRIESENLDMTEYDKCKTKCKNRINKIIVKPFTCECE